jgi:hypothetical protein
VLEITIDAIEKKTYSFKTISNSSNIPMNYFFDHLNGKTRFRKMKLGGVLTKQGDAIVNTWTLIIQECGQLISLQQFKMKVVELTQIKVTPFPDGIPNNN